MIIKKADRSDGLELRRVEDHVAYALSIPRVGDVHPAVLRLNHGRIGKLTLIR